MAKYSVILPVTGYYAVDVEDADSEKDAIDKAFSVCSKEHLETWETHERITQGNVCHAEVNEAYATLVEEE